MNFLDADGLAGEDTAEVDLFVPQTDAAAVGDHDDLVVERIIDVGETLIINLRLALSCSLDEDSLKILKKLNNVRDPGVQNAENKLHGFMCAGLTDP